MWQTDDFISPSGRNGMAWLRGYGVLLASLFSLVSRVYCLPALSPSPSCECGYSVNATSEPEHAVFTDLLESDFTRITDLSADTDWRPQVWELNPDAALGPFGRAVRLQAVIPNPAVDLTANSSGIYGGHAGLNLLVPHDPILIKNLKYLIGAELDTARSDMFHGTFRIGYRTTKYPGTCFGFYWYHDDKQEIDIELLSRQSNDSTTLVNLVLHTPVGGTNQEALPGTYTVASLPYDTSDDIHELRFDWTPAAISWYHDGTLLWTITNTTLFPRMPGHIVVTHWSNGNPLWSGGPPEGNSALLLTYVKAYFNSSDPTRQADYNRRCGAAKAAGGNVGEQDRVCEIPSPVGPPRYDGVSADALPYFFSNDVARNATVNQTVYNPAGKSGAAAAADLSALAVVQYTVIVCGLTLMFAPRLTAGAAFPLLF
ncbi:Beta-glucanase [Drechslerella dactyloides]|uniref:Beta-glucanase n=1 Tax=Drechslerella dactyloides TaxID=74499 RepID=A0AAD6IY77_DREDA|nr:Beta-glucanase [Drechslerella dactyloides]